MPELLLVLACCMLLAAAVIFDVVRREIPNAIPVALLGLFAVHAAVVGQRGATPLWADALTAALLLALGFGLFLIGALGAGDGKLLAAAGLWIGPAGVGSFLLGVGLLGVGLGLFALLPFDATRRLRDNLPFAVAIAPPAIALLGLRALGAAGSQ
ncbi:MAG: prepilin peptidase [Deltaproteobacteria bacterium]|nr:prepilin peptidase [Deltaproteobacteria bacterium]